MRRALIFLLLVAAIGPLSTRAQAHEFEAGQTVVVTFSSKPVRLEPTATSRVVTTVVEGDLLNIIDSEPVQADGLTWWHVETIDGSSTGWLPDNVFAAVPENASGTTACWTADQKTEGDIAPAWAEPPAMTIDPAADYVATITTIEGTIVVELDAADAPIATNNFICLANAGYYDGTDFHRVSSDFLIQGGDATGTGTGGPGYVVPSDPTTGSYPAGSVALASVHPGENGSQFFIAATDLTGEIPDDYPVFGQVISGQDVVTEISRADVEINPRGELSQPVDPITIESIEITEQEDEVGPPLPTAQATTTSTPGPSPTATAEAAPTVFLPPTESTVIELDAKDIAFAPTEISIDAADEPVTIEMTNTGAALHNFSIDALDISVDADPGETVEIVIPAGTAPGSYDFYCDVPGHKEAGMVGTLIVVGSTTASTTSETGCDGFAAYSFSYDQAYFDAIDANPAIVTLFEDYEDSDAWLFSLTPIQLGYFEAFYSDLSDNLALVIPPDYARQWHQLQIEAFDLLAEFFGTAQDAGIMAAGFQFDETAADLEQRADSLLAEGSGCPAFDTWALEETLLVDDALEVQPSASHGGRVIMALQW
ncbi:MAG TPA: peptidylprolyl isomerase [Thermomicrobiales bacterium]|nr:peptidylprolyl isomerase [Thermomicrobiales bacterium]